MAQSEYDKAVAKESKREHYRKNGSALSQALSEEGSDFLKGGSPVPLILQAETEIIQFINKETKDSFGALKNVLQSRIKLRKSIVASHVDTPLVALKLLLTELLEYNEIFYDFVREVDSKYGQLYQERPLFQNPGEPAHPDDEYTHENVKIVLEQLLKLLNQ